MPSKKPHIFNGESFLRRTEDVLVLTNRYFNKLFSLTQSRDNLSGHTAPTRKRAYIASKQLHENLEKETLLDTTMRSLIIKEEYERVPLSQRPGFDINIHDR